MSIWKSLRLLLLMVTCGMGFWGLSQALRYSASTSQAERAFEFPSEVPLLGWRSLGSEAIADPPGQIYRYSQNSYNLELEMYYVTDANTNQKYFSRYNSTRVSVDLSTPMGKLDKQAGSYLLSIEGQRAYLRTCINPQGQSTITYEQFLRNRDEYAFQPSRLLSWLLGKVTLRDHRCLWTHLSLPLNGTSPPLVYQTLETAWIPWYEWWQTRFPQL